MYCLNKQWLSAILFLIFLLSFTHKANTAEATQFPSPPKQLIDNVTSQALWKKTEWINLIHYVKKAEDEYLSSVVEPKFFLAENGKENPQSELMATLAAFYSTDLAKPDEHAQCRFIARLNWLKGALANNLTDLPTVNCPLYNEWRAIMPAHKVSLIFPAYHLNSPSSMFGHTLLRIDPEENKNSTNWLSMAVNFGANIDNSDNSIIYAFKGLAGGYPGIFIVTPYFKKIKEYNREENRDIWEYPLNLTPQETKKLVHHLWELKEINFKYYFFDENCSYRLLELLQVARPGLQLTNQFGINAIPVDTVRSIEDANLIIDTVYRPSQATNVRYLLKQLSDTQMDFVFKLAQDAELVNSATFKEYDLETQNIILDAAYRFLRYEQNDMGRSDVIAKNSYRLLQTINKQPDFNSKTAGFVQEQRPEKGHFSKLFSFSIGDDDELSFAQLELRLSFHSLEDQLNGFLQGAQINLGNMAIRAYEEETQLQYFDLIDIFSITPRNQFFKSLSWRVYTGLEQQLINGKDHLTGHVTGGAGVSYELWSRAYFYTLLIGRLESNSEFERNLEPALGISSGLLQHFSFGTNHLEISGEEFLNDEYRHRVKFTQNIPLAQNHAIQLFIQRQRQRDADFTEAQLRYHYYFH